MDEHRRYQCTRCKNTLHFEVTTQERRREYHHFTLGGAMNIDESVLLGEAKITVKCVVCDDGGNVVELKSEEVMEGQDTA